MQKIFKILTLSTSLLFINNISCSQEQLPLIWDNNGVLVKNTNYPGTLPTVNDSNYGFHKFNTNNMTYVNVSELNSLFLDGETYNTSGLTNNMPSTIQIGLIGNENDEITINNPEENTIQLFGDNSKFLGKLNITNNNTDEDNKTKIILRISNVNSLVNVNYNNKYIDLFYSLESPACWDISKFGNDINVSLIRLNQSIPNQFKILDNSVDKNSKTNDLIISGSIYDNNYKVNPNAQSEITVEISNPHNQYYPGEDNSTNINRVHFKGENSILSAVNSNLKPLTYVLYNDQTMQFMNNISWFSMAKYTETVNDIQTQYDYSEQLFNLDSGKDEHGKEIKYIKLTLIPYQPYRKLLLNKDNREFSGGITIPAPSSGMPFFKIAEYDTNGFVPVMQRLKEKNKNQEEQLDSEDLTYNFIGNNDCKLDVMNKFITNKNEGIKVNAINVKEGNIVALSSDPATKEQIKVQTKTLTIAKNSKLQIKPGITLVT